MAVRGSRPYRRSIVTYATTGSNWSGDTARSRCYNKTNNAGKLIVGGSFSSTRNVDWLAIGT
jgi:hypothetical protein